MIYETIYRRPNVWQFESNILFLGAAMKNESKGYYDASHLKES